MELVTDESELELLLDMGLETDESELDAMLVLESNSDELDTALDTELFDVPSDSPCSKTGTFSPVHPARISITSNEAGEIRNKVEYINLVSMVLLSSA